MPQARCEMLCLSEIRAEPCTSPAHRCGLRLALKGNPEAREVLFSRLYPRVYAQSRRLCRTPDAAEDLAQASLLMAHQKLSQLRDCSRLLGWISRVVTTTHLLTLRRRHFAPLRSEETSLGEEYRADPARDPGECLNAREAVDAVLVGISRLSPALRSVLELRVFDGRDTAATARALGISEFAVRTRLRRARQALRQIVMARWD
jgi:RNA polymerase sigma-70 factor, ECF subfamily